MIKNYIKIAWRSILKNKLFSLLNIIGLSVSLCISILLLAYTNKELSFDRMYPKVEEIYRVKMKTTQEYNYQEWVTIPNAVGQAKKKMFRALLQVRGYLEMILDRPPLLWLINKLL